eukprot:1357468-Pleurochrysis_carterae.AAC.2
MSARQPLFKSSKLLQRWQTSAHRDTPGAHRDTPARLRSSGHARTATHAARRVTTATDEARRVTAATHAARR